MCGIAGFLVSKNEGEVNVRGLASDLLLEIESRGRDATGAAWFDGDTVMLQKDALPARQFVPNLELPQNARNVILHTRLGTKGTEYNNNNNHPVATGGIVGVHNGGVWNDDSLFRRMGIESKRIGEVDTEAIFAAIAYGTDINPNTGKPRLAADLLEVLGEITGSAAIAWLKVGGDPNVLELARISSSPLHWGQTAAGTFIFASTKEAIERATKQNDLRIVHWDFAAEGDYYLIREGRVDEYRTFETAGSYKWKGGSTYSYNRDTHTYKKDEDKETTSSPKEESAASSSANGNETNAPFVSPITMHARVCQVLADVIPEAATGYHYSWWKKREDRIDDYLAAIGEDTEQPGKALQLAGHLHAHARVGSWVVTDLGEYEKLKAQIYLLPQTFPEGSYILRVLIPNQRYATGYEPVLVERQPHEFTMIKNPEEASEKTSQ